MNHLSCIATFCFMLSEWMELVSSDQRWPTQWNNGVSHIKTSMHGSTKLSFFLSTAWPMHYRVLVCLPVPKLGRQEVLLPGTILTLWHMVCSNRASSCSAVACILYGTSLLINFWYLYLSPFGPCWLKLWLVVWIGRVLILFRKTWTILCTTEVI